MVIRAQRSELVGKALKETWEKNYEANKAFIKTTPPFMQMFAKSSDCKPAVAVGAGPSLTKNIDKLDPKLYDIIACDKISGKLIERGITPTYIVALNAAHTSVKEWLEPAVNQSILVMPCSIHPEAYEGWRPELCRFINNMLQTGLHERITAELRLPPIVIGSNAGTMSYLLSGYTFHNPIAYIGMDFSFLARRDVLQRQDPRKYNVLEMTDLWKGEEVRFLDLGWWDMAMAFQEHVQIFGEWYGLETYNCTEGGVNYSQYVQSMSLENFNDMLLSRGKEKEEGRSGWDFCNV